MKLQLLLIIFSITSCSTIPRHTISPEEEYRKSKNEIILKELKVDHVEFYSHSNEVERIKLPISENQIKEHNESMLIH